MTVYDDFSPLVNGSLTKREAVGDYTPLFFLFFYFAVAKTTVIIVFD